MRYLSFGVFFFIPPFLTVGQFLGVTPNQWKRPIRFPDEKFYAESFEQLKNYYSRSMLDPENWWCVLVQFEIFGLLNQKKDLKIPYVWHFICLLIINFKKKCMPAKLLLVDLLEISYTDPLLSAVTLQYHRLYQISSLEANLSLEDLKQLCRTKPPSQVYLPTPKLIIRPDLF